MKTNFLRLFALILLLCSNILLYAAEPDPQIKTAPTVDQNQPEFNLKQANSRFDQLNLTLSTEELNVEHLEAAITTLEQFINDANAYVNFHQKKLTSLDNLIKEAAHDTINTQDTPKAKEKTGVDLAYLEQEQKKLSDKIAQCRLFIIRAQEAINAYQLTVAKIKKKQVLTLGLPLWTLIEHLNSDPNQASIQIPNNINLAIFSNAVWYKLGAITLLCLLVSTLLIRRIKLNPKIHKHLRVKHIRKRDSILLFLCLFSTVVGLACIQILSTQNSANASNLITLILIGSGYLWALACINTIFKSHLVSATFFWYSLDDRFFKNVLIFFLSYYTVSQADDRLAQIFTISDTMQQLIQIIFHSAVIIASITFTIQFCHAHRHIRFIQNHPGLLQWSIALLFLACGALNILGYHQLAIHFTYASINTIAIFFAAFLLLYATQKIYLLITESGPIYQYTTRLFGYRSNQTMVEFFILKLCLQIIILGTGLYLLAQSWGYGSYYINSTYAQLLNGIPIANITLYPTRIMAGLIAFCILYLFFRWLSTKVSHRARYDNNEEETQVAIASILTYSGFACALVIALLISGVDFTGLAIVAGALSVGIGLGLQGIVNNFVSGIILLIEKPIKPGDRISIDGHEGVVKKIRVRSTQIMTAAREDIIIPNSDLITHSVTNFMYTDQYLSVCCTVGVTYDCNPNQVKAILLQAATAHDDVLKSSRSKPYVLLQQFGNSAMIFEVWFLIKDGNKKATVRSDINFKIDQLFREQQIKIAHPQRDITVRTV